MDAKILGINERRYPTPDGMDRRPVTVVLVAGDIGDYAAYAGAGTAKDAQGIARHGDKISFTEATAHFPHGLDPEKYRT